MQGKIGDRIAGVDALLKIPAKPFGENISKAMTIRLKIDFFCLSGPAGDEGFVKLIEKLTDRDLSLGKPGRPRKRGP
ncbi:MAG: hypothetical protein O7B35_04435 [Deltaproteobacteria bacterium]|nr:hypothetical protein [Deltaproteobacteria bacterium]